MAHPVAMRVFFHAECDIAFFSHSTPRVSRRGWQYGALACREGVNDEMSDTSLISRIDDVIYEDEVRCATHSNI